MAKAYTDEMDYFWRHVERDITDDMDCWLWTGPYRGKGYGLLYWQGESDYAHRWSYTQFIGDIPDGFHIHHNCDKRMCVNPNHLEALSMRDHLLVGNTIAAYSASRTHCPQGHPYSIENTYMDTGNRKCRICRAASKSRYYFRRKDERKRATTQQ